MKLSIDELAEKVNKDLIDLKSDDKRLSNNLSPRRIRDYISKGVLDKPFKDGKNIYFTELHYDKLIVLRTSQYDGLSEGTVKKILDTDNYYQPSLTSNTSEEQISDLKNDVMSAISEIKGSNSHDRYEDKSLIPLGLVGASINYQNNLSNFAQKENQLKEKDKLIQSNSNTVNSFISSNNNYQSKSLLNSTRGSSYESQKLGVKNENLGVLGLAKSWTEIPLSTSNKFYLKMESNVAITDEVKKEVLENMKKILGIN